MSYLADLSLAEDDHDWQVRLLWRRQARDNTRLGYSIYLHINGRGATAGTNGPAPPVMWDNAVVRVMSAIISSQTRPGTLLQDGGDLREHSAGHADGRAGQVDEQQGQGRELGDVPDLADGPRGPQPPVTLPGQQHPQAGARRRGHTLIVPVSPTAGSGHRRGSVREHATAIPTTSIDRSIDQLALGMSLGRAPNGIEAREGSGDLGRSVPGVVLDLAVRH